MANYQQYTLLGPEKTLGDIVIAGSHDAGITEGSGNVQTQGLDIQKQAEAGVRLFDIRITGSLGGGKDAQTGKKIGELTSYHGGLPTKFGLIGGNKNVIHKSDDALLHPATMKVKRMGGEITGAYGQTLTKILQDARNYVDANKTEFLILKFDKCNNWDLIAEACIYILGDKILPTENGKGDLNVWKLKHLSNHVIVLFSEAGLKAIKAKGLGHKDGILGFRNLFTTTKEVEKKGFPPAAKGYNNNFHGIQYIGKGGTSVGKGLFKTFKGKMNENIKKQGKIMDQRYTADKKTLGMMYWTTTGALTNIKKRNEFLWSRDNEEKMVDLWKSRIPKAFDLTRDSTGGLLREYMPNIVMIDFANAAKAMAIYKLNFLSIEEMLGVTRDAEG